MADILKDGASVALVCIGFVLGGIVHAALYIWRESIPDDHKPEGINAPDPIDQMPSVYVTLIIALLGVIGVVAISLGAS